MINDSSVIKGASIFIDVDENQTLMPAEATQVGGGDIPTDPAAANEPISAEDVFANFGKSDGEEDKT